MNDRLSSIEAIMWRVGQDAALRMTVGSMMVLDRSPTEAALAERLAALAQRSPRLRRRPNDSGPLRSRPEWVDDTEFDMGHHLRTLSVAPPGTMRQVLDLLAPLESVPYDPERSPWDATLIEGLDGGRAALYLRAHHVLTDGLGGLRLVHDLLDVPDKSQPAATTKKLEAAEPDSSPDGQHRFGSVTVTVDVPGVLQRVAEGVNAARDVDPVESALRGVQRALDVANSVSRQIMVAGGPLSSWPESRSLLSRFEVLSVDGARETALALGGSRNDLLVAAAATAIGAYQEKLGQTCIELRLATPNGQRRRGDFDGNWFVPTRVEVPVAVGRPGPQFGVIVERLARARHEPALRVLSFLASTIRLLPTRLLLQALQAQADSVDFAATAVPGLHGPHKLCGSRLEAVYPFGPRLGCPMNITAMGNNGGLDVGIALDPAAFAQPELLVECLREAFASFAPPAKQRSAAAKRAATAGSVPHGS
jgi:diacylglycerol O-acyltransferase / wax synthase